MDLNRSIAVLKLARVRQRLVASPRYLADHGLPSHPSELDRHRWLACQKRHSRFFPGCRDRFRSHHSGLDQPATESSPPAARSGLGLVVLPAHSLQDDIASGPVVRRSRRLGPARLTSASFIQPSGRFPHGPAPSLTTCWSKPVPGQWEETMAWLTRRHRRKN